MAITSYLGPSIRCHFQFFILLHYAYIGDVVLHTCDFSVHFYVRWKPYCRMNRRIQECNVCATARPTKEIELDADEENKSQTKTAFSRSNFVLCLGLGDLRNDARCHSVRSFVRTCVSIGRIHCHTVAHTNWNPGIERIQSDSNVLDACEYPVCLRIV